MQFGILGPLVVRSPDGGEVAAVGPRPRAVLAMLLLDAGRLVSVERLIDGQYGDRPPSGAANAVQAQISRLRRRLPGGLIEFHGSGYRLAVSPDDVDAHRFERLSRQGRRLLAAGRPAPAAAVLGEALDLWRGPALTDVADAPFAGPQAVRLEELRLTATEDLLEAELALPEGNPVAALRELVTAHPLRERPRGLLMRALYAAGRQAEALAVFDDVRRLLARELGADPSPELTALHLAILRGQQPKERPARTGPPAQLTSFVGREDELARLATLRATRLVTIVGPGGTGKTRLAVEAATRRAGETCFADLSLADVPPPARHDEGGERARPVAQAVLGALGLREPALPAPAPPDPVERLVAALAGQDLLLVLDNCEHVIDEAAALARRLLSACPRLTVLATSREPLGITGEHLVTLGPLPTAPLTTDLPRGSAGEALGYPAVRLFADRAAAVRPGFVLTPGNLDAVLRICAALDGLPLAIELAAARVRTFSVAEIASRLAEHGRFRLLSRGDRTAAARHQTLYAAVEWSWSLLTPGEQALARRFAVFAGGADAAAVERVCADPADPADRAELADLVDKSLVESDGERCHMLETIRLFCLERLAEAGEEDRLRQAHAAWFLELARRADDHLCGSEQLRWLALLSADNTNLQAALRWSVTHDRPTAWRLVAALAMYWWLSGRRGQATRHAVRLLDSAAAGPPAGLEEEYVLAVLHAVPDAGSPHWERARTIVGSLDGPMRHRFGVALWGMFTGPPREGTEGRRVLGSDPWSRALERLGAALLTLVDGSVSEAERRLESVLADFGALGERWGTAQALDWLAVIAAWRGDWARAMELWKQAIDRLEELGALDELVDVLGRRADARLRAGDVEGARAGYERVGVLDRRLGRPELSAWVHFRLGNLARLEGNAGEASRRLGAALAGAGSHGFTATRAHVLTALGRLAEDTGDVSEAARRHEQALASVLESPLAADLADVAEGLAGLALVMGGRAPGAERAAELLGVGVALRGTTVAGDPDVARVTASATEVLGPEAFAAAFARGASMSAEKAREALRAAALPPG
ncbi:AfsR/SARP family transcriptional regulator [Nonomuraea sp. KC401]|uniref:BTAD domain-containing putative transcriptional regulator n=1 Tax=unclassified Nonomuraea TaxID=2593643 RepID=UPI0010FD3B27|nr:BTAD domain-containing putative transcriptional regulator [Nonomuraea sp. KC401]NBE94331.1 AfsR/SARP family transcriptional regulator [Nonomuraea sp. K271]TLF73134.1 AfsR/SARP family transcriptional regulator [Nonomuraea sp. KC401]